MLLKVQCEKCKSRYKLEESRIQGKGAKITCPKCRHVFVVMKDSLNMAESGDDEGDLQDTASESVSTGAVAPVAFPNPPARAAEVPAAPAVEEPAVQRPSSAESLNWKDVGLTTFKVKVAIGLVYDFSDIGTLRKYIAEKRVAPTDRLSFDGKIWTVIKDVPDLDAFFIDQWVALKVERLKDERAGKAPSGPTIGDSKRGGDKRATTTRMTAVPVPGPSESPAASTDAAGAPKKTAWSADAGGQSGGLFGQDLFDDVQAAEDSAGMGAAQAARGAGAGRNTTTRRTAVPVPEPRTSANNTTTVAREPVRMPMPVAPARGFRMEEGITLALLAGVVLYLGVRLAGEMGADVAGSSFDRVAVAAEIDKAMRPHFPVSLGTLGDSGASGTPAGGAEPVPAGGGAAPKNAVNPAGTGEEPKSPSRDSGKEGGKETAKESGKDGGKESASKGDDAKKATKKDAGKAAPAVQVGTITAEDLFQLAQESLKAKDTAGAIQSLKSAVSMKPGNSTYQYTLGIALLQAGQDEGAEQAFKKAVSVGSPRKEGHKWLGDIYARRGQKAQAIESYKKYLQTSPRDAAAVQTKIDQLSNS